MRKKILWILGAGDFEMSCISGLLQKIGQTFVYAEKDGVRITAGQAYSHDPVLVDVGTFVIAVECSGDVKQIPDSTIVRQADLRCDHHRMFDFGYGKPPELFLEGSSVGQVIVAIDKHCYGPQEVDGFKGMLLANICTIGFKPVIHETFPIADEGKFRLFNGEWIIVTSGNGGEFNQTGCGYIIPKEVVLTAAADHCLQAAYAGLCPGVNQGELYAHRTKMKAEYQKRSVQEVQSDIIKAGRMLMDAKKIPGTRIADMRPFGFVDELPEASAMMGIPFLQQIQERKIFVHSAETPDPAKGAWQDTDVPYEYAVPCGQKRIVLMGVPQGSDYVQRFLNDEFVPGLERKYGCAARGFAGGYIPE